MSGYYYCHYHVLIVQIVNEKSHTQSGMMTLWPYMVTFHLLTVQMSCTDISTKNSLQVYVWISCPAWVEIHVSFSARVHVHVGYLVFRSKIILCGDL